MRNLAIKYKSSWRILALIPWATIMFIVFYILGIYFNFVTSIIQTGLLVIQLFGLFMYILSLKRN